MANDIAAETPLFSYDQVRIDIQDLVRTGFMDKYNELAEAVITDITWRIEQSGTSGGSQVLEFHTSNLGVIEIPIIGGSGVIDGLCAEDICYDDEQDRFDNVQDALDYLLNPYQSPSGNTTGAPGLQEVGDESFYSFSVTSTGNRGTEDLEYVQVNEGSNLSGNSVTTFVTTSGQQSATATIGPYSSTDIDPSVSAKYTWTGKVKDVENAATNAGSDYLQYVYPYYKFNNSTQQTTDTQLESLINSGSISSILNSSATGPNEIELDAATDSKFMHILVPTSYDDVYEIIDANLGLGSAPGWDTVTNPDSSMEFRREYVNLTKTQSGSGANWTNIDYYVYYSKIQKSNLSLIFKL